MKALLIYHQKLTAIHSETIVLAICELKVWEINNSQHYPEKWKYSLFWVEDVSGKIIVGYDNHFPKGHHKHIGDKEIGYDFIDIEKLYDDFWKDVRKLGFIV